jgi:hypothetical protein
MKPHSKRQRVSFHQSFYTRLRQDAASAVFPYKGHGDARDPRGDAKRIRKALDADAPLEVVRDIETGIHLMALCAGNPFSLEASLESQYLAAYQRNADYHGGLLLQTPEELKRISALCRANRIVQDALDLFDAWRKGKARSHN